MTKQEIIEELNKLGVEDVGEKSYLDLQEELKKVKKLKEESRIRPETIQDKEETKTESKEEDMGPRLQSQIQSSDPLNEPEDYLRKYQVRKDAVAGSIKSDPQKGSKAETMKKKLLSQSRVRMFIPRGEKEAKSIMQSVILNGYRLDFPKQTYIEVPLQVYQVLSDSLNQTEEALRMNLIEGDKDKEKILN